MQLADKKTHLALTYIAAANRRRAQLSLEQLEAYVNEPALRPAKYAGNSSIWAAQTAVTTLIAAMASTEKTRDAESTSAFLTRVFWLDATDPLAIGLTALGKAMLSELDNPRIDLSADDPLTVVIDPSDPFAYARVFDLIVDQSKGMIVDPYLGFKELIDLLGVAAVRRVLISDHDMKAKRPSFEKALAAIADAPELRALPLSKLHDRFFIPDSGDVLIFGSSLNSITKRPGVITPLTDSVASGAIRESYETLWSSATVVKAATTTP